MKLRNCFVGCCVALVPVFGASCGGENPVTHDPVHAAPGAPIPGLDRVELLRFERGAELFDRPFTPEEGLGPLYNQDRCSSCHDLPVPGGAGTETATLATRFTPPGSCDPLVHEGGNNIQQRTTPLLREHGVLREASPPSATARTSVTAPSLFGLGLIEAVPLSTLERLADPDDADGDGISGRIGRTEDGRPGRFGRKAEFASIREFTEGALRFEMGITTPSHPEEEKPNGNPLPDGVDPATDPEIGLADLELLTDFIRFLAPAEPVEAATDGEHATMDRGEQLFEEIGCSQCHVPLLESGPGPNSALSGQAFFVYSDLLLHDLGSGVASICGAGALPGEFRTARLTGLRFRGTYLHDGSASSIWGAITAHGGEGAAAQARFLSLGDDAQQAVIQFISTR